MLAPTNYHIVCSVQDNTLIMGLSPKHHQSSGEKVKITEAYRKKQEAIASESHQKMTRLAQRRHSTCQKMNRLKRQNSGHENEQRRHGLKQQLNEINEEMHKTFIQSKVSPKRSLSHDL